MYRNLLIGITAFGVVSATTTVSALAAAPNGHARTTTAVQASLNYCSHQTGGFSFAPGIGSQFRSAGSSNNGNLLIDQLRQSSRILPSVIGGPEAAAA